ncbi:hypothetical protein HY468_04230 [Candidatus Roizmanbacteria bacterium]|nr:hypothetical protein [Candidatus Roizmanbacteria bacterium]
MMTLPKSLTTVTTFSKVLAVILFISLPVSAFFLGKSYQRGIDFSTSRQKSENPAPTSSDTNNESELLFVTYGAGVPGYRITGQTTPPNGWLYWKINLDAKQVQILDKNDAYFKEFAQEGIQQGNIYKFNFNQALDTKNGISENNKLVRVTERNSSSFLVQVYKDNILEVWKFNPDNSTLTQITTVPPNICIEQIIDWDSDKEQLLGYTTKPSLTDSSSSDISNICLYDYKNQTVLLNYQLPGTKQTYYAQAFGTIQSEKVVLDGSHIAVLDLNSQYMKVLEGYEFFGYSRNVRNFIENGILPLQNKDSPGDKLLLSLYNLQNESFSEPICFDRIPADEYIYDSFLSYVLDSDRVLIQYSNSRH